MLNTQIKAPCYESSIYGETSFLDSVCIWNETEEELAIFAVNKSLEEDPERVIPTMGNASRMENKRFNTVFGKHSWNVVRLKK